MNDQTPDQRTGTGNRHGLFLTGIVCVVVLIGLFVFGASSNHVDPDRLKTGIDQVASSPWGVLLLIGVVCACAFMAVPQFVLIGVAVYAFGPLWGAIWFWVAALCSGMITFWTGWFFGDLLPERWRTRRLRHLAGFITRNAFAASLIVRNVPTGPFIVVNMIFGAMRARILPFFLGMAIGIIPKILLFAFGWHTIQAAFVGQLWMALAAGLVAFMIWALNRAITRYQRRSQKHMTGKTDDQPRTAD